MVRAHHRFAALVGVVLLTLTTGCSCGSLFRGDDDAMPQVTDLAWMEDGWIYALGPSSILRLRPTGAHETVVFTAEGCAKANVEALSRVGANLLAVAAWCEGQADVDLFALDVATGETREVGHVQWWSDANGRSFLCYAAFGLVLTRLEQLDDNQPAGEQPTALDEDRAALRDDLGYPAQLAFVERRTGIRLDPAWLGQPHATVVIRTPIPDDPRPPGTFGSADPDLAAMFLLADESTQRAALRWVLDLLADEHDLRSEPAVRTVLDALPQHWPTGEDLSHQLDALRFRLTQEVNASPGGSPERWRHYQRMRAGEAFAATIGGSRGQSDPPDTLWYAQQAFQQRWPTIRAELWRRARRQPR